MAKAGNVVALKRVIELSNNAIEVLNRRYLKSDLEGKVIETPEDMFRRVAHHIALAEENYASADQVEKIEDGFYEMLTSLDFLPNSPTLMNAGRDLGQLAACFVLPISDSLEDIFETIKNAALIHKSGGGSGFSFSRLRPKDSRVGTTGGVASGPVSFMKIFNTATEQVKQGGTRRGANMAILNVDHPDIMEFITCKQGANELNNFNISVGITDKFMEAVEKGESYDLIDPHHGEKVGELAAREVFGAMVKQAWSNGDPGIIFMDRVNRDNVTPDLGQIEATNPCGEQPLLPMEACNLGSINLTRFIKIENERDAIDYDRLGETVRLAVRFLDNAIDMSRYPLDEIDKMVKGNRKIGLGVMGFADLLFRMGVPYNSEMALSVAMEVMKFISEKAEEASIELGRAREEFPNISSSIYKDQTDKTFRNATRTTIAPTGTLSIIADCSSGIEPLFALSFVRRVMDDDKLLEVNPIFEEIAREDGFYSEALMEEVAKQGSIQHIEGIPDEVKKIFVTAHDITPEWHVKMQAAFQKYTDNAVSKTVNLPRESSIEDVAKVYDLAYRLGVKGVTIYRDGSKENQVLSFGENVEEEEEIDEFERAIQQRPETLEGFTTRMKTGMGNLYVTVTEQDDRPFEVFATIGKSGMSTTAKTEAIGRLISLALRAGVKVDEIVAQIKGIGGEQPVFQDGGLILSIPDAIGRVLENRYLKGKKSIPKGPSMLSGASTCPDCGQTLAHEEGCNICHACGFSKCG